MNLVEEVRERLRERRAELQEEIEVVLPQVEQLQARILSAQETIARLSTRRDKLAAYGNKPIEIPQTGSLPELGQVFTFELEPLRSRKTGKQLAAEVQTEIDPHEKNIRACEREIDRLLSGSNGRGRK